MFIAKFWRPALAGLALLTPSFGLTGPAFAETIADEGHFDVMDVGFEDGALVMVVHNDAIDKELDPADVIFLVKARAQTFVPNQPQYSFLGSAGSPVWILPQVQDLNLLWPGIATLEVPFGALRGNTVQLRLVNLVGPGRLALYTVNEFGAPTVLIDSGASQPKAFSVGVGAHAHQNWAFTAAGRYKVTFEATGTLPNGQEVSTGSVVYTFDVAPTGTVAQAPAPVTTTAPAPSVPATTAPAPAATTAPSAPANTFAPPVAGDAGLAATQPDNERASLIRQIGFALAVLLLPGLLFRRRPAS